MRALRSLIAHPCWWWNTGHQWVQRAPQFKVSRLGFMFCECSVCGHSAHVHVLRGFVMLDAGAD